MKNCDHENLDVYHVSIDFIGLSDDVVEHLPKGRAYLADQFQRAATSIVLNLAEGAGEFSPKDKGRFYGIARRSATECAAILDVCSKLDVLDQSNLRTGRELLLRIVAMLTQMAKKCAS
jgi:four helix bundle protein